MTRVEHRQELDFRPAVLLILCIPGRLYSFETEAMTAKKIL